MKQLHFKCLLLTNTVISAQTATEGAHRTLNFIPGSTFLGILASDIYTESSKFNYDIFHSGKVRFGDAHIVHNNHRSFQVPFTWFFPKGGKITGGDVYMSDFIDAVTHKALINGGVVLQQARNGYFTREGVFLSSEKIFAQKTGYDPEKRKSLDNAMFGYEALQEGSDWQFSIDIDNELLKSSDEILNLIKSNMVGEKFIGRSKTAEFGMVQIDLISENDVSSTAINPTPSHLLLYAESRLAFFDKKTGQPSLTPDPEDFGLPDTAKILWKKSQIRTGMYAPWNQKRRSRDQDRIFIEKGSVFTVDISGVESCIDTEKIYKGIGYYRTEGFGKIRINPNFLKFNPKTGKVLLKLRSPGNLQNTTPPPSTNSVLLRWLKKQPTDTDEVLKKVDEFIKKHANKFSLVTKSQWGNIRSRAITVNNADELLTNLFEKPGERNENRGGDLYHGVEEIQWVDGREIFEAELKDLLKKEINILQFTEQLAARMQKEGGPQ